MAIALVLVSVALVVCLYVLLMGKKDAPVPVRSVGGERPAALERADVSSAPKSSDAELDKKRKELDELKKSFGELKDELKAAKKKLFDQRGDGKAGEDLVKARTEVERQASIQLENTRAELSHALAELQKMKGDEGKGSRRSAPLAAPAAAVAGSPIVAAAPAAPPAQKVIRELSDSDRERITRAEAEAAKGRQRIADLEKAMKNSKGRGDAATHQLKVARQETTLAKDKFRAVEHRVNRLMLERDLMVRAIKDLETRSGITAERVELTAAEVAASDQRVNEKEAAEARAEEEARLKLETAEATAPVAAEEPAQPAPEAAAPAAEVPPAQA